MIPKHQLSTERKEPLEVLEAYNSTKLVFTGNSSQLVPWHEKLGFRSGRPPVCTMNKLTPDGGVVAVMDLTIVKVHPIGFLEVIEDDDGKKRKSGLWDEKEEARLADKWRVSSHIGIVRVSVSHLERQAKREAEASKIRDSLEKKLMQMEGWIERLMRKAGGSFTVAEDGSFNLLDSKVSPFDTTFRFYPRSYRERVRRFGRDVQCGSCIRQIEWDRGWLAGKLHSRENRQGQGANG